MSIKFRDIGNKLLGAGMLLASVGFFANMPTAEPYLVPGILFGAGGFWLAVRREKRQESELPPAQPLQQLSEGLTALHSELVATQERLERLEEERDFMRQLAAPSRPTVPTPPDTPRITAQATAEAQDSARA